LLEPCNYLLVCRSTRDDGFERDNAKTIANVAKHKVSFDLAGSASSLPEGQRHLNVKNLKADVMLAQSLTDDEIIAAAKSDPDNLPMTAGEMAQLQPLSPAKRIRRKLGLSQEEFAQRFRLPLGTLRDWEQHRREPIKPPRHT
jgi:putative transcriptional regulator